MRVLVTGARGFVGGHLGDALRDRHEVITAGRGVVSSSHHIQGDLADGRVLDSIASAAPEAVVHLAALTDADLCEREPERARIVNAEVPGLLAAACASSSRRFLHVSTDLVFDGERAPYGEDDLARPLSVYGETKLEGERAALSTLADRATIVRLALVYGSRRSASSRASFLERMLASASRGGKVPLYVDEVRTPIYVEDAARALAALVDRASPPAVVHLGGPERLSRFEMGARALAAFGLPSELADPRSRTEGSGRALRPRDVSLRTSPGLPARRLAEGLAAMRRDMERLGFMVGSKITVHEQETGSP